MEENAEEIAYLESYNGGKPIAEARFDVSESAEVFRYYAGFADKIYGKRTYHHRNLILAQEEPLT